MFKLSRIFLSPLLPLPKVFPLLLQIEEAGKDLSSDHLVSLFDISFFVSWWRYS